MAQAADDNDPQTEELDDLYMATVMHHDREYQRYALENGAYFVPIDELEAERLGILHDVFGRLFDDRLIFPPIARPRRILECGFGTASWAIDVANRNPSCEVVGVDISPHMISDDRPENVDLQVDDLNQRFTFDSNHFDLVHSQMMAGGIHADRWRSYLRDMHRVLRPGGWCQLVEIYFNAQSDNGSLTNNHALRRWSRRYLESIQPFKDPRIPLQFENLLRGAGFVDIECRLLRLPMCGWPNDPRENDIGTANRANIHRLLSSLAMYQFTERLGMTISDFQILIAQARAEADNPAFKAYFPVYVAIGRKRH